MTRATDCCGPCPGPGTTCNVTNAAACASAAKATSNGTTTVFSSGPSQGGAHRFDGFYAIQQGLVLAPGPYRAEIAIAGLRASANGGFGIEGFQQPKWAFEVRTAARRELGAKSGNFATVACSDCKAAASDLHPYTVDFVVEAPETALELVIWAQHQSSQCFTEVYGVEVEVDYIRISAVR